MSKQTAVEWLVEQLSNYDSKMIELFNKEIEQAKEMEKQQIIDACNQIEVIGLDHELPGKKYYNQTFNK
jgi:hypothetical protein